MIHHAKRGFENRDQIESSQICGCFYCKKTFKSSSVEEYIHDSNGQTAVCPLCGIDSVVPHVSDTDGDEKNFKELLKQWYEESFT